MEVGVDLNSLLILTEVAKHKSFSQAARTLGMPSSNVSRKIQQLEEQLGAPLLHRTTRSVTATAEGKTIVALAQGLVNSHKQIQEWSRSQSEEPSGPLKITAPESFARWPLGIWLIEFQKQYPLVSIELVTESSNLRFDEYELDFAFRMGPLDSSNLIAKPLFKLVFGYFASRTLIDEYGNPSNIEKLLALPSIGCTTDKELLPWIFKSGKGMQSCVPNAAFKVKDQAIALNAVEQGLGVGFLPISLVEESPNSKKLIPLLKNSWPKANQMYLVYRDKEQVSTARHKAFLGFIRERIKLALG